MSVDVLLLKLAGVQFESFLRCIVLLSVSYLLLLYFFILFHKRATDKPRKDKMYDSGKEKQFKEK